MTYNLEIPFPGRRQQLILREANGVSIRQRHDNYFDATAMCRAYGKLFANWRQLDGTQAFLEELALNIGIPIIELVQSRIGRDGGTWVHERVAIKLADWCSPKFAVIVNGWIYDLMHGLPVNTGAVQQADPFLAKMLDERDAKLLDAIKQAVRDEVPTPRREFLASTRDRILTEYLRQNPHGMDPTGRTLILERADSRPRFITGEGELHHMNGPYCVDFRDGLPVAAWFHAILSRDREQTGAAWRRARTAHRHFLDIYDAGDLLDTLAPPIRLIRRR